MLTKSIIWTVLLLQLVNPSVNLFNEETKGKDVTFYVGTYTRPNNKGESSKGIYKYQILADGSMKNLGLAAESENPSFIAKSTDGKYLLAANENREGTISSFSINGDEVTFVDKKPTNGMSPCFVTIDPSGEYVVATNYNSGSVALYKLTSTGMLDGPLDVVQHEGKGTEPRQAGPHAHSAWFDPSAKDVVISADLGTNEIWFSKLDRTNNKLVPMSPAKLAMPAGSGPRHLAFHKSGWVYVINELSSTIVQVKKNSSGAYEVANTYSTLPKDFTGAGQTADIRISSDGKFLYGSNRGNNTIVIFEINKKDGSLSLIGHEPVHGVGPRNFNLTPDNEFLMVANQQSSNIVSFKRDAKTGTLKFVSEIAAPSPVCLIF